MADSNKKYNYTWRSTCAQLLTIGAFHSMMMNVGVIIAAPGVVIGALHQLKSSRVPLVNGTTGDADVTSAMNSYEHYDTITFTDTQQSLFGSLVFLVQPLGSLASGVMQEWLGRKRCLYLVNALQLVAWLAMCQATTVTHLFVGLILLGLTIGFEEAPVLSYLGEVTEPRLRGLASSSGGIFFNLGLMLQTALGWTYSDDWRRMLRFSAITPLVSVTCLLVVPESPTWLVSKGRIADAHKAYQWLRGWVPADCVQQELDDLVSYVHRSRAASATDAAAGSKKSSRWRMLLGPSVLRPLRLIIIFFFISNCTSLIPVRPFIVPFLAVHRTPISPEMANFLANVLSLAGAVVACVALPAFGKRPLAFVSLAVCVSGCAGLALCLAPTGPVPAVHRGSLVLLLFGLVVFASSIGVMPVPWILISELFPLRAKGLASGVSAAAGYVLSFLLTVSYHRLRDLLTGWGVLLAYGSVGLPGAVYLYRTLPETEGVPLERAERLMMRDLDEESGALNGDASPQAEKMLGPDLPRGETT